MNERKTIYVVTEDDYLDLSLFLANFPNETRNQDFWLRRFRLWWDNNPSFSDGFLRGWFLREYEKITGFIGCIPSSFVLNNLEIVAYSGTTWRVLEKSRNQSMNLFSNLIKASKKSILFDTTPNSVAENIITQMGFKTLSLTGTRTVIRISYNNILEAVYRKLKFKVRLLSKLLVLSAQFVTELRLSRFDKSKLLHVRELERADYQFDQLWETTKSLYSNTHVRTSKIINWYCFSNSSFEKKLFGCYEDNKLAGYMIFEKRKFHRIMAFECIDLWCVSNSRNIILSLLAFAMRYATKNVCDTIIFPHYNDEIRRTYESIGVGKFNVFKRKAYYKAKSDIIDAITNENTYFVRSLGDVGL